MFNYFSTVHSEHREALKRAAKMDIDKSEERLKPW